MAGVGIMLVMLALTLYYPLLLRIYGDPDMGPIWTSYLGLVLMGSAAIAIGIFVSSLTNNQIISAVVTGGILFGLWYLNDAATYMPTAVAQIFSYLSLQYHFSGFTIGLIDTRSVIYYLSLMAIFLYSAVRSLETGRWS
jgi:ABC-2 type transport system permease protein